MTKPRKESRRTSKAGKKERDASTRVITQKKAEEQKTASRSQGSISADEENSDQSQKIEEACNKSSTKDKGIDNTNSNSATGGNSSKKKLPEWMCSGAKDNYVRTELEHDDLTSEDDDDSISDQESDSEYLFDKYDKQLRSDSELSS